ncbi:MAG: hypothetical protein RMX96_06325 [Nostoc sp. ChiSLP02]|nr:hypothetical protein [Nostoc sp. DedSLP05]MDZ8103893.1 hypothetical protein [Nostoc sp. DedSLP01]MDZ8184469.1 hypothetical protein [Nostoc sp. ChiSLP02]
MVLAQDINIQGIQGAQKVDRHLLSRTTQLGTALAKQLLWHAKAYSTVFSIMLLTFASLIFVYIHWSGKKLTQVFQNRAVIEQK